MLAPNRGSEGLASARIGLRQRRVFISAWGNAPGIVPNHSRALKARFKTPMFLVGFHNVDHRNESRFQR
jgi:hypothetical protein